MVDTVDRGPYYKMLDRQALARYASAFTKVYEDLPMPRFATGRNMTIYHGRLTRSTGQRNP